MNKVYRTIAITLCTIALLVLGGIIQATLDTKSYVDKADDVRAYYAIKYQMETELNLEIITTMCINKDEILEVLPKNESEG